jgi:hypothetical protein
MADLIQNIDYNLQGYHKDLTIDAKGDLVQVLYYRTYDPVAKTFSDLKVKETRTYIRRASTLLEQRSMLIEWLVSDDVKASKQTEKYYNPELGYKANKRSRQNLIDRASMYLLSTVGLDNAKAFLDSVSASITTYIDGNIEPLVNLVSTSTEAYMTTEIKATLDVILNVNY